MMHILVCSSDKYWCVPVTYILQCASILGVCLGDCGLPLTQAKAQYQAFWGVLFDLIVELLGLLIKNFDNHTESWNPASNDLIIKSFDNLLCTMSPTNLLPTCCTTVVYLRFLYVPSSSVRDSFVITSQKFGIHSSLQCAFQRLVHSAFLESIMLFSSCSKGSLYRAFKSRATMELSPHPNDIRVRSLHMTMPWQLAFPIVKDAFLAEVVIWDLRNWFFR
jgi:hypothetical protein